MMKIGALTDLHCNRTRPLTRRASAIPPPARLRAGGHREFPSGIDHHACGLVPPHRISPRLVGNHEGCPYKCNGVDNHSSAFLPLSSQERGPGG